jgi:hypothetical protein
MFLEHTLGARKLPIDTSRANKPGSCRRIVAPGGRRLPIGAQVANLPHN